MKKLFGPIFLSFVLFLPSCSQEKPPLGQIVVMKKCTECHSKLIICTNLGKDNDYWQKTVQRMAGMDIDITEKEINATAEYLYRLPPGADRVCR